MSHYAPTIKACLSNYPLEDGDERRVEAWMRLRYGTLDGLGFDEFREAALDGWRAVRRDGRDLSDQLATTYGL